MPHTAQELRERHESPLPVRGIIHIGIREGRILRLLKRVELQSAVKIVRRVGGEASRGTRDRPRATIDRLILLRIHHSSIVEGDAGRSGSLVVVPNNGGVSPSVLQNNGQFGAIREVHVNGNLNGGGGAEIRHRKVRHCNWRPHPRVVDNRD